jgi:SAM-dependent methyltransferase
MSTYQASDSWQNHFQEGDRSYPSQGLIRVIRGTYPNHKPLELSGKVVLDIGSGDGRNSEFLRSLGARVHGLEISQGICDLSESLYPEVSFAVGESRAIPFHQEVFDICVAWNSVYYMKSAKDRIGEHFDEIFRVTRSGGRVIFSIPMPSNFIYSSSRLLETGEDVEYVEIANDPFGVRNGQRMARFRSFDGLQSLLILAGFSDIRLGEETGSWFGLQYDWWVLDCLR